jgi:outer membrane protein
MIVPMLPLLAALLLAAPAHPAPTADTLALTLDAAVARALAQSEEMRSARASVLSANGQVRQALSQALPQLNGTVSYNRKLASVFSGVETDTIFGPLLKNSSFAAANTWSVDLTGSQLLWSSGKVGSAFKAARAARRSAQATQNEVASEVTYQVTRAYLDAAYAQRLIAIAESGLEQSRAHLDQVALYRREGSRAEYDLLRAQVDAANQEPAVVSARNDYNIALLELERLVDLPLEQPITLTTPLAFDRDLVPVVADVPMGVADRPALQAAEADVEARRLIVNLQKGRRWPDLRLSSTLSHQAFPDDQLPRRDEFRRNWEATIKLEVPIFSGLQTEGLIDQARADFLKAQADRDRLRETAEVDAARARADLARSLAVLEARRSTVRQARRAWELSGVRYTNGLSTQLEVSDARLQFQTSEVNEVQATRDYRLALAQLEHALGHRVPVVQKPIDQVSAIPAGTVRRSSAQPPQEGSKP